MTDTKKTKIYLGWLSTGVREDVHIYLMRDLQERYGHLVEFVLPDVCAHRIFHDRARNDVVEEFLDSDCDILWFLDSDVCPPTHVLDLVTIHKDKWLVAGAPYPVYQTIPGTNEMGICFTVYNGLSEQGDRRGLFMSDVPHTGTEFVDGLATGCLFIKREVFAKLERPFFEFKFDPKTRVVIEGEDLGFCLKLHDLGIKFFVDHSMVCKHVKRLCLLEMQNLCTKKGNAQVVEYDKQVREAMTNATKTAWKAGYQKGIEDAKMSSTPPKTKSGLVLPSNFTR
jgi:hypothetical protein